MKRILLLCLVTTLTTISWAQSKKTLCLAVVEKNGEEVYFALDKDPIISHMDNTIKVTSDDYAITDLPIDDVVELYHTEAVPNIIEGIGSISTMDGDSADFTNGKALIKGLKEGAQVYIYTVDGQTIGSVVASKDGNVCIDLSSLKSGVVYILRTPSTSYKIAK